ncbi:MAG TPA: hypothetical protein PLL20_13370 [Phycisphaerae bacterium]|nr:hypothetical protein [Phycisphaerae bacterium]HRR83779.1 hypothetical protein [Phycisphaerae bacterium]
MAVNDKHHEMSATGRRLFFGTNVFIVILLLAAVVVGINFLFTDPRLNKRWDLSAGSSSYRLSQRTKNVLKQIEGDKIAITTVYTSVEPEYERKTYFPRVEDLCDEIAQFDKRVRVTHCYSPADKLALRNRIQGKFGGAAEKHNEVIAAARTLWEDVQQSLPPLQSQIEGLQRDDNAWLGGFSSLNRINLNLKANLENIAETRRDVQDLTEGQDAMPKYQEATNKIKQTNDQLKQTLEDAQKWCKDINSLATVLSNKDSDFAAKTRKQLEELDKLLANLVAGVGDPSDTTIPDDPKPAIQDFAKASNALGRWLTEEVGRVNSFVKANPAIEQHPRWMLNVQLGPLVAKMPLSANLSETAQSVSENVQAVRQVLSAPNVPKDQLQSLLRQLRQIASNIGQKLDKEWKSSILAILDDGARIDQASRDFLARGSEGTMFKEILDKIADIAKKIESLPKLELDEIAERLQDENLVVIEVGDQVRVVKFDEVWPIADPTMRMRMDESRTARVFDGDSAISGALLAMTRQKKYGTVIFVAYETEADPMARRMGQGGRNTGRIPLEQLSTLKDKLKQANFAVKDWNLGAEGTDAERPQPEEGTEAIYVFLPPAETSPPNPMMGRPPEKGFGEEQLEKIRPLLTAGSKAIFLATWVIPRMSWFGPEPVGPYAYGDILSKNYGVEVHQSYRLLRVLPDTHDPTLFGIDIEQVGHMQLSSFSDQPIGAPLKARRMLMNDVCPVTKVKGQEPPADVSVSTILEVPAVLNYIWAFSDKGIQMISKALSTGENRSQFRDDPDSIWKPPFSVALAIEKSFGENEPKSRVVVLGTGASLTDWHLTRRVPRFLGEGKRARFQTDPPPTENADLFVNAVLWLCNQEEMIASGPSQIPLVPVLKAGTQTKVLTVTMVWAAIVFVAGIVVMLVRSK